MQFVKKDNYCYSHTPIVEKVIFSEYDMDKISYKLYSFDVDIIDCKLTL
jgi:hypothetical protein